MRKPYKYTVICDKTGAIVLQTNTLPPLYHLHTWEATDDPAVKVLKQTKTVYIDTRYDAKLRLYNYTQYTKKGLEIPRYKPFSGTEIGKTLPILNF